MKWKRPTSIENSPSLFGSSGIPRPQGIHQGGLGDCWFLSGAAAVAEEPDRIYRVMNDKKYNPSGIFRFYFWVKDGWYGINVSDELPMNGGGDQAFSARKS